MKPLAKPRRSPDGAWRRAHSAADELAVPTGVGDADDGVRARTSTLCEGGDELHAQAQTPACTRLAPIW